MTLAFTDAERYKRPVDRKGTVPGTRYFSADDFTFDPAKGKLICPKALGSSNRSFE